MPLGDLFKSKQELEAEQKKLQKKELRDATRSCERLHADLERQEKDLQIQIKNAATKGDQLTAKTLAKQLIKVRNEKVRATGAKSKITSIASHASNFETTNKLSQIMANSASVMSRVNNQIQPEQLAKQMNQFREENTKIDMADEAMNDMFDELFEGESEEADSIMNQVLDELSIETGAKLANAPSTSKSDIGQTRQITDTLKLNQTEKKTAH